MPFVGLSNTRDRGTLRVIEKRSGKQVEVVVDPVFQVNHGIVAKELARTGVGAGLVIASSVEQELSNGELSLLSKQHHFGYVAVRAVRRDKYPTRQALAFLNVCQAWGAGPSMSESREASLS